MFTNRENCTVWQKTTADRAPAYIRHEFGAYYHEITYAQETDRIRSVSHEPAGTAFFCIPAESVTDGYLPKTDDRILDGICTDNSPPGHALTVTVCKDFRYGSPCVRHIEVTAK